MAIKRITGNGGIIAPDDFKEVKIIGKTKGGQPVRISINNALNMGNLEWAFAEKGEVVPAIEFEACYNNTDEQADETTECPWVIEIDGEVQAGANEILLGTVVFYVGETKVALCRGGGSFKVEREFRPITADNDKGTVKDRVAIDTEKAKVSMNVLTMLTNVASLYPALKVESAEG